MLHLISVSVAISFIDMLLGSVLLTPCLKAFSTREMKSRGATCDLSFSGIVISTFTFTFDAIRSFIKSTYELMNLHSEEKSTILC